MSLNDHVKALEEKHAEFDKMIHEEEARPLPDPVTLHGIKRQKLAVKDEIAKLVHP